MKVPDKFELEQKTFPTDYRFIRAGSRGKELTVSEKSDQYAKFFTVGEKQILMPDDDEDDIVKGLDLLQNTLNQRLCCIVYEVRTISYVGSR